jgi:hypothetical protein
VVSAGSALALALLLVGLQRLVRAVRGQRESGSAAGFAPGVGAMVLWCGVGCALTVVTLAWYLVAVARLALDYQRDTLVVTGGWVGVRLVGVLTVTFGVLALRRIGEVRRAGSPVATGLLSRAALGVTVLGGLALLVVLAYWGVFQLGI